MMYTKGGILLAVILYSVLFGVGQSYSPAFLPDGPVSNVVVLHVLAMNI